MAGAEVRESCLEILFTRRENVRLGKGLVPGMPISREIMARALSVLEDFSQTLREFSIEHVRAVGTAALRKASDSALFLDRVRNLGIPLEIIDWHQEASLAAKGAFNALGRIDSPWAMIDVGGGSTEVVVCQDEKVLEGVSIETGAVSMLEMLPENKRSHPPFLLDRARHLVSQGKFSCVTDGIGLKKAVGTGGTATTVAAVKQELGFYQPEKVRGYVISLSGLRKLLFQVTALSVEERRHLKGLEPERADIFPAGIAILSEIVSYLELNELIISDGGLLSGLLATFTEKECDFYVEPSCARSLYF